MIEILDCAGRAEKRHYYGVSTGSGSDRVSTHATVEIAKDFNPVATAPGTDLIRN